MGLVHPALCATPRTSYSTPDVQQTVSVDPPAEFLTDGEPVASSGKSLENIWSLAARGSIGTLLPSVELFEHLHPSQARCMVQFAMGFGNIKHMPPSYHARNSRLDGTSLKSLYSGSTSSDGLSGVPRVPPSVKAVQGNYPTSTVSRCDDAGRQQRILVVRMFVLNPWSGCATGTFDGILFFRT